MTATVPEELRVSSYYSIPDTARMLQVCQKTVYNMIAEGYLDVVFLKCGYKKRVKGSSIKRVITEVYF